MPVMLKHITKIVSESHPCLSPSLIHCLLQQRFLYHAWEYNSKIIINCECPIIPTIKLTKLVTYNSQNYAGTLGSGLLVISTHTLYIVKL